MNQRERDARLIVEIVLERLARRKGFDHWWDDLDDEIREDIQEDCRRVVVVALPEVSR